MTLNVNVAKGLPFSLSRQKIASDMQIIDTTASVLLNFGSVFKGFVFKGLELSIEMHSVAIQFKDDALFAPL